MNPELESALASLCSNAEAFDKVIETFEHHRKAVRPVLRRLLRHPDPAWRRGAATAMARLKSSPAGALPDLLKLLRSPDASAKIAAIAAIDYLPPAARKKAVQPMIALLKSAQTGLPAFTRLRANLPRAIAAHFLAAHGGDAGIAALKKVARRRRDPMAHQIDGALRSAMSGRV